MNTVKPIIVLGLLAALASGMSQAAPQGHSPDQEKPTSQQHGGKQPSQGKPQQQGQAQQGKPSASPAKQQSHGQPPQDFSAVHQQFQQRREQIGRGNPPPANVHIVKGKPLPAGYGKRLDSKALKGLPHYEGYEWRRVGSDMVLVTVATGIVYTILSGVLN